MLEKIISLLKSEYKYFILAGLIVIFQVFGDANHRTAKHFYKETTGKSISLNQETKINNLLSNYDYYGITNDPIIKMYEIVNELYRIASSISGGKTKNKHKNKNKNKVKQISKIKLKKIKNKSKKSKYN